jgi:uncharacterized protein (DUF2147 family)
MKKNLLIIALFIISAGMIYGQADKVIGIWLTEKKGSQIRIFKATDGKYYGKIEWLEEDKDRLDVNNPNEKLRSNKVWGMLILRGFNYNESKKQWEGGTIYDPENGKTYDCYMWFDGNDNQLHIKGYVLGMKFIGRETLWSREKELRK